MGMNFELLDGERIITYAGNTVEDDRQEFADMVQRKLGFEAKKEMLNLFEDYAYEDGDDYEQISDEYRGMLIDTMNELESIIDNFYGELSSQNKRLNRGRLNELVGEVSRVRDNIYKNM